MRNRFKTTMLIGLCLILAASALGQDRITYFHNDAQGSPVAATDADGDILWTESYLPYGARAERSESTDEHSAFYTGKPHDDATGLTYMGARDYDPVLGRFLGMDPVGFDEANVQSFNKYAYGNNNPYRFADPNGESPLDLFDFAVDVGALLVQEIVWVAATIGGDAAVADMAAQGIRDTRLDATISTVGVINPVPGTSRAYKTAKIVDEFHPNSRKSTRAQVGYLIIDNQTGRVSKVGVSSVPMNDKGAPRALQQIGPKNLKVPERYTVIYGKHVPEGPGARGKIYDWERDKAWEYRDELDRDMHKRPWPTGPRSEQ